MTTAIINTKTGGIESYDYSDLNEFFKKKLIELNNRLTGGQAEEDDLDTFLAEAEEPKAEEPKKVSVAETIKSKTSETKPSPTSITSLKKGKSSFFL